MRNIAEVNHEKVVRFKKWLTAQKYLPSTVTKYCNLSDAFCDYLKNKPFQKVVPMDVSAVTTANLPVRWTDALVNDRLA